MNQGTGGWSDRVTARAESKSFFFWCHVTKHATDATTLILVPATSRARLGGGGSATGATAPALRKPQAPRRATAAALRRRRRSGTQQLFDAKDSIPHIDRKDK
jgi:hypothetical protein